MSTKIEEYKKSIESQFPKFLKPYKEEIFSKIKEFINLKLSPSEEELPVWQSNVNGKPYIPLGFNYPKTTSGKPLKLLAQLNFEELPKLNDFPEKGILQFFVDMEDDVFGLFNGQYKVIYHENIIKDNTLLMQDFSFLESISMEESMFSKNVPFAIEGEIQYAIPNFEGFIRELPTIFAEMNDEQSDNLAEALYEFFDGYKHKIGGYHDTTQSDVLEGNNEFDTLLFQLDTDVENDIMWGDSGVGNFFIKKENLLKLDFSKVLYEWNCC